MTKIPADHINAELRKMGRVIDDADDVELEWQEGELGLRIKWPDGLRAFVGTGPLATAVVESFLDKRRQ